MKTPREAYEGPGFRDQFETAERQRRQMVEDADRIEAAGRDRRDRKQAYADQLPRYRALRAMASEAIDYRPVADTPRARMTALRAHPVFRSLPASEQAAWEEGATEWVEQIATGLLGRARRGIDDLARRQAVELEGWSPPAVQTDAAADVARIPRG